MFEHRSRTRTWGFRFNTTDALVIAALIACAILLRTVESPHWWILVAVGGHFFLFCNVFRARRSFEVGWAALFIINVGAWLYFGEVSWMKVLGCQLPISVAVIFGEVTSPRYHGILARSLNPKLNDYLEGRIA